MDYNLLRTITPKGARYYVNGFRVTREFYDEIRAKGRLHSLRTVTKDTPLGLVCRHFSTVSPLTSTP